MKVFQEQLVTLKETIPKTELLLKNRCIHFWIYVTVKLTLHTINIFKVITPLFSSLLKLTHRNSL